MRHGPTWLCIIAVFLVMADLTRHVLQDADMWNPSCSGSDKVSCTAKGSQCKFEMVNKAGKATPNCYSDDFWNTGSGMYYGPDSDEVLSWTGVLFTIILTYLGFACLIVGVFWSVNFVKKFKGAWQQFQDARRPADV